MYFLIKKKLNQWFYFFATSIPLYFHNLGFSYWAAKYSRVLPWGVANCFGGSVWTEQGRTDHWDPLRHQERKSPSSSEISQGLTKFIPFVIEIWQWCRTKPFRSGGWLHWIPFATRKLGQKKFRSTPYRDAPMPERSPENIKWYAQKGSCFYMQFERWYLPKLGAIEIQLWFSKENYFLHYQHCSWQMQE